MSRSRFTGFRTMCEGDFQKSNMDGVLARDFNVVPQINDKAMDMISPGSGIEFKGKHLERLNKLIGIKGVDTAQKLMRVIERNDYGVRIEDISGGCDDKGLSTGMKFGRFSDRPFPHMPCSPTNGQKWWISA